MTAPVDWSRWRKCDVCGAETGVECMSLTGVVADGRETTATYVVNDRPHSRRKPRTGGTT